LNERVNGTAVVFPRFACLCFIIAFDTGGDLMVTPIGDRWMHKPSILRWLVTTGAIVCAITIISALGAAVFTLLCGALCWVFRVERVPFGFLWATTSGAIAGLLMGTLRAIDRAINWQDFSPPPQDDSRPSAMASEEGKAFRAITINKLPKDASEGAAAGQSPCPSTDERHGEV
jgi:hypothetical protein